MDAYIYETVRTARGSLRKGGAFTEVTPLSLLGSLLVAMKERTKQARAAELILGCVTQKGEQGGNLARTAALIAGYGPATAGMTLNNFCCSGLDACQVAALKATANRGQFYLAGGVESMSRVVPFSDEGPYYSDPAVIQRTSFSPMWLSADFVATKAGMCRTEADQYAALSQQRAAQAQQETRFNRSIVPVGDVTLDENVRPDTIASKLSSLPTFQQKMGMPGMDGPFLKQYAGFDAVNHIHHAGSAPSLADAASLVLIGSKEAGEKAGLTPRARIVANANTGDDPLLSLTGGIKATQAVLAHAGMKNSDIDLFEFNEAYAAVCLLFARHMDITVDQMNVNGGAIALGHPMGATGAILLVTVLDELERQNLTTGCIALSGAAGLGSAMVIERV